MPDSLQNSRPVSPLSLWLSPGNPGGGVARPRRERQVMKFSRYLLFGCLTMVSVAVAQNFLTITSSVLPAASSAVPYSTTLAASGGQPPYSWSALNALPAGLSLSADGSITGTPTAAPGSYNFAVKLTDASGTTTSQTVFLTVQASTITIAATTLPGGIVGQSYPATTLAASGGTPPYHWSASSGFPPGLALSASSGGIAGTPTSAGTFNFTVQAADAVGNVATRSFTITVSAAALSISTTSPVPAGTAGSPYSTTFAAENGVPPYTWVVIAGNPGGLTLTQSGTLQGTPQTTGTYSFTVQVTDSAAAHASQQFSLAINGPSLTVTAPTLPSATLGGPYPAQTFSASGGTPPYAWSVASGALPAGLKLDPIQGTLSGTPTAPGTFTFTVQATDSKGLTGSKSVSLTVVSTGLSITNAPQLPNATLGSPFTLQMTAIGGTPPYSWSANGLPSGVAINSSSGLISGTVATAGQLLFTVTVRDAALTSVSALFQLSVVPPSLPPVTISGMPATAQPLQQYQINVSLGSSYPANVTGTALLTFAPDSGAGDGTLQFASGGQSALFTIPAGSISAVPLMFQAGTVSGTITLSLRLQAGGADLTPDPAPSATTQLPKLAPVITSTAVTRNGNTVSVQIVGYATSREVTQATFNFAAAQGQSLQTSQFIVPVDSLFSSYFSNAANSSTGGQFVYTQPFTIQGDANAVLPQDVALTNRIGTVTATVGK